MWKVVDDDDDDDPISHENYLLSIFMLLWCVYQFFILTHTHTHTHKHLNMYIYIYLFGGVVVVLF